MARPWKPTAPPVPQTCRQQQRKSERKGKRAYKQRKPAKPNPTRQDQNATSTKREGISRTSTKPTTETSFVEKLQAIFDLPPIGDGFSVWIAGVPLHSDMYQRRIVEWKSFQRKWNHLDHEQFIDKVFDAKRKWRRKVEQDPYYYLQGRGYRDLRRYDHIPPRRQHRPKPLRQQHAQHSDSQRTKSRSAHTTTQRRKPTRPSHPRTHQHHPQQRQQQRQVERKTPPKPKTPTVLEFKKKAPPTLTLATICEEEQDKPTTTSSFLQNKSDSVPTETISSAKPTNTTTTTTTASNPKPVLDQDGQQPPLRRLRDTDIFDMLINATKLPGTRVVNHMIFGRSHQHSVSKFCGRRPTVRLREQQHKPTKIVKYMNGRRPTARMKQQSCTRGQRWKYGRRPPVRWREDD